jgi:hypothetical protein
VALELAFNKCIEESLFECPSDGNCSARQIRIVETYQTRLLGALVSGDPGGREPGPRRIERGALWSLDEGNAGLADRYAKLLGRDATIAEQVTPFPLVPPPGEAEQKWARLCQSALDFVPSIGAAEQSRWRKFLLARAAVTADAPLPRDFPALPSEATAWRDFNKLADDGAQLRACWHDFLTRRYRRIERLNRAWQTSWPEFDLVALPDVLPETRAAQTDWLQFERQVQALRRTAHHFSVLLPVSDVTADAYELDRRLGLARRIVELEKPAHTTFDVRFYWAFFRIGEARLGIDTQLGAGSRAPELIPEAVLGRAYIGASFVGGAKRPQDGDRLLLAC